MKTSARIQWIAGIAALCGFFILLSIFTDEPIILAAQQRMFQWAALVSAVLLFMAVIEFILARVRRLGEKSGGFIHNFLCFAVFLAVLIFGFTAGRNKDVLHSYVLKTQIAVESVLAGLVCLALLYGVYRAAKAPGSVLKNAFLISSIVFMVLFSGILSFMKIPDSLTGLIQLLRVLPTGGIYGLLIGLAIGALVTGVRILFWGGNPNR